MFKPLELYIGLRYTGAKRRNHFISFISLISILGIALGVTALITVLSVMNGFEQELRQRILGMTSHATISNYGGVLKEWPLVAEKAREHGEVVGAAPYIDGEGMLAQGSQVQGAMIRGILPEGEPQVSEVAEKIVAGELEALRPGEFGIVLGHDLARMLGTGPGDKVTLVTPSANVTPAGILPRMKRFTVVAVFEVGMYEYDSKLALIHIEDAARLFRTGEGVTGVRLKLEDMMQAPWVSREVAESLPGVYRVSDWRMQHSNFFQAIRTEKTVMFVILFLIVAVAAFNIVSTLVMVVTDKKADIAILRTLGISPGSIMSIFMVQGTIIGLVGTLLGLAGGMALALNVENIVSAIERLLGVQFLPADVYYISKLPSQLEAADVVTICIVSFLLSIIATLYPAWRAAATEPAEALRYE